MRAFDRLRSGILMLFMIAMCAVALTPALMADGDKDGKNPPPAKATAKQPENASAELMERERMLLDRLEQLEKRVAELEAKGAGPATAAPDAPTAQPSSASVVLPDRQTDSGSFTASAAPPTLTASTGVGANAIATEKIVGSLSLAGQVTENGKAATAKAPASEPFAFADFTWLNGMRARKNRRWTRNSSRRRFARTCITSMTSITRKTTASAAPAKYFARKKFS